MTLRRPRAQRGDRGGDALRVAEEGSADDEDVGAGAGGEGGGVGVDAAVHLQVAGGVRSINKLAQAADALGAFGAERLAAEAGEHRHAQNQVEQAEGRRDPLIIRLHPDVSLYVLEQERDLAKKLEKSAGFNVELRDDPLLNPDEFKIVVKGAMRDVTQQYGVA